LHVLNRINQANQRNVNLSQAALDALEAYPWPGNIRELANVIERLVLLTDDTLISKQEIERFLPGAGTLPQAPAAAAAAATASISNDSAPALVREYRELRSHTPQELQQALARHGGNRSRAAQSLGLTARQFSYRLGKLGG
jgi:Nif-specific regulatory protein